MSSAGVAAFVLALAAMSGGFLMVFFPERLNRRARDGHAAIYALRIFGMMLFAFGLTIAGFVVARAFIG